MKIVLIGSEKREGVKEIKKEMLKKGVEVEIWDVGKSKKIPKADKFMFLGLGSFDNLEMKGDLSKRIREEEKNREKLIKKIPKRKMINRPIPAMKDKQYWFLKLRGIPVLKTKFTKNINKAIKQKEKGKLLKPVEGSLGIGVISPDTPNEIAKEEIVLARKGLITMPSYFEKIAIQDEIKSSEIIKVIITGDDFYAVKYVYPDKKRNLMENEVKVEKAKLTEEEKDTIKKIKKRIGTDFIGVDLIRTKNGTKVLELNSSPILTKVEKKYPKIYSKIAETIKKKKKGNFYEEILSKMRKRRR